MGASILPAKGTDRDLFNLGSGMPFSRKGAWIGIFPDNSSLMVAGRNLYIGSRRGSTAERGDNMIVRFFPTYRGEKIDYGIRTGATELILRTAYGEIRFCFADEHMLYIKGENGLSLRLERTMKIHEMLKRRGFGWEQITSCLGSMVYAPLKGSMDVKADWDYDSLSTPFMRADVLPDENGEFLLAAEESMYGGVLRDDYVTYEEALRNATEDWNRFKSCFPPVSAEYAEAAEKAMYTQWSFILSPAGRMKYPLILMTPRVTASSWQMIENVVAMKDNIPLRNAFLMNMLDEAGPDGQLPDFYDDVRSNVQGLKPPVQGWGLKWIMRSHDLKSEIPEDDLMKIYEGYSRLADWYMLYRDDDRDGLPEYDNGDESGYDDATAFASVPEIEAPDLAAYLVLLYEALGDLAEMLGRSGEADAKRAQSAALLSRLVGELWNGEMFIARDARTHEPVISDSVIHYLPIVLGSRLPKEIIDRMTEDIMREGEILSPYGLASERPSGQLFRSSGFGRGFVLPVTQILTLTGMYDAGKTEEAKLIARRYCDAMRDIGFNMILNPVQPDSGAFACSWPACAFLILANLIENM